MIVRLIRVSILLVARAILMSTLCGEHRILTPILTGPPVVVPVILKVHARLVWLLRGTGVMPV